MEYTHSRELFYNAVHMLYSHGSQRERLINATCEIRNVSLNSLPSILHADFEIFMKDMKIIAGVNGEGAFAATINSFNELQV